MSDKIETITIKRSDYLAILEVIESVPKLFDALVQFHQSRGSEVEALNSALAALTFRTMAQEMRKAVS